MALIAVGIGLRLVFGEMTLTTGLTVLLLAPDVYWPLRRIGVEFHAAQDGRAAADAAFALIGEHTPAKGGTRTVTARGAPIRLERLTVAGRDGRAPWDLNAVIEPGAVTVLTGRNGAGKSTTLQVIAGITEASSGRVTVAGVDVADLEPARWWAQLSWLPQRPVLVPGTVDDNLALLGELEDRETACAVSGFDAVLAELPEGGDTVLGRGGVGLSLGQRQRLGLARALGSTADVLLLDEPTAHLDARTEERVLRAIAARARRCDRDRGRAPRAGAGHRRSGRRGDRRPWGALCPGLIQRRLALNPYLPPRCCCGPGCRACWPRSRSGCSRWAARWRWPVLRRG